MRVKRYIVDSMPEALEKIRIDLGMDAVILNSKPIKTGGVFGMFSKQQIEVVAAVDEKPAEKEKPVSPANVRQKDVSSRSQAGTYTAQQAYRRPTPAAQPAKAEPVLSEEQEQAQKVVPAPTQVDSVEIQMESARKQIAAAEQASTMAGANQAVAAGNTDALASEFRDMRQMFQKLLVNDLSHQLPPALQMVRTRLLQQEVTEEITAHIIQKMMASPSYHTDMTEAEALQSSKQIIETMLPASESRPIKEERAINYAFYFGPTGVGKTTTIAKMAASSMLKDKRRIGFITADTYRMAAVEQLKTYANILNVPLEVVFSPKEMEQAMERLSDCDLIFVDTAGRNFRNDEYVDGIRDLVQHGKNSVNYLVLSLTSKYNDMRSIINNFAQVPVKQVIFTKADETQSFGNMLNVSIETGLALSYLTTGQNVPDDIMVATPAMVSNMIMGE